MTKRGVLLLCMAMCAAAAGAQDPVCSRFDTGREGWTGNFATCRLAGGTVVCDDRSGPSSFSAPPAFLGSWVRAVGGCGQLCFEIDLIASGLANPIPLRFTIRSGAASASFFTSPITAGSGLQRFCAPVFRTSTGMPPITIGSGGWALSGNADWNALIENVTAMEFAIDYVTGNTERIGFDNICFEATCPVAEFEWTSNCASDPVAFTDRSRMATSWLWTFGASGVPSSTEQNPVVQLPAGTHDVTLCINGGDDAPLCITHPVTVKSGPPVPSVTGSTNVCGQSTRLCAAFELDTAYQWSGSDVEIAPDDARCVKVAATGPAPSVTVVATSNGCSSRRTIPLQPCPTSVGECCIDPPFTVRDVSFVPNAATTAYEMTALLDVPMPYQRITASLVGANIEFNDPADCGGRFPMPVFFSNPQPVFGVAPLPGPPFPLEVIWPYAGPSTTVPLVATIGGVQHATLGGCNDVLTFCVKFSVTSGGGGGGCRTCDVVRCFTIER